MSRAAEIVLAFGGEDRVFRLPIGRLRAIQEKCDAGPLELLNRLYGGTWRVDDLREVLLQGLIGGGLTQAEATGLMLAYFDDLPLAQFVPLATAVLGAAVLGVGDEPDVGKSDAGAGSGPSPSPAESSGSPKSTAPAASLA